MKKRLIEYIIPHKGLKEGIHHFTFCVEDDFFAYFEDTQIQEAKVNIAVELENKPMFLHFTFVLDGKVLIPCDRCLSLCEVRVQSKEKLLVNWKNEKSHTDDANLETIPEEQAEFDLSPIVYELLKLTIPMRNVHEEEVDCDQETISRLNELRTKEEEKKDPRWEKLNNI